MESAVDECVDLLVDRMSELSRSGKSFDLQFWMQCYAFDVIGQITASTLGSLAQFMALTVTVRLARK
jgi:hypothetical protein